MMWTLTNESYKLEVPPPEWTTENLRSVGRQCLLLAVLVISFWSLYCFFSDAEMWRDFAGGWKQFSNTENLKMGTDLLAAIDFGQNVVGSTNVGALPLLSKIGKVRNFFLTNFKERIFLQLSCFKSGFSWWKSGKVDRIDLFSFLRILASEWFWFYSAEY